VLRVLSLKLREAGYEVDNAADGQEALELARGARPAVLVTDLHMPHLGGLDLCRALEADPATAGIPTIVLTSWDFQIREADAAGTSIRKVIAKPFSPRQVLAVIATLV
jgi:two-component system cell cycle response regulator